MCNKIVLIAFILCLVLLSEDKILSVRDFITSSIKALRRQAKHSYLEMLRFSVQAWHFISKTSLTAVSLEMNLQLHLLYSENSVAL